MVQKGVEGGCSVYVDQGLLFLFYQEHTKTIHICLHIVQEDECYR